MEATTNQPSNSTVSFESATVVETEIDVVAGHLNALHARLVDTAIVLLANPSWWRDDSVPTLAKYLCWRTAIAPERAKQLVTIAERANELPVCMARFRRGELSVDHMAAIARRAPWWVDAELAELAPMLSTHQLRGTLARYQFPLIPKPDEAEVRSGDGDDLAGSAVAGNDPADTTADTAADAGDAEAGADADPDAETHSAGGTATDAAEAGAAEGVDARAGADSDAGAGSGSGRDAGADSGSGSVGGVQGESLWFGWDDQGRFQIHGALAPDTGLVVEAALKEAADRLFHETGAAVSWPDALREVADRSLDQIPSPDRRDRYRIHLHLDLDGTCTDAGGRWLPDTIRRHLGCDGTITPTFTQGATPIAVGRAHHIVPARTRRQVLRRDRGMCRVPGCGNSRFVEIHHIIHWEHHGHTEPPNLLCLCPQHHRLHHRGQLGITGDADQPDGVTFTNRHGQPIPASGARPQPPPGPPEPPRGNFRHPLGERLESKWLYFNPPRPHDHQRAS